MKQRHRRRGALATAALAYLASEERRGHFPTMHEIVTSPAVKKVAILSAESLESLTGIKVRGLLLQKNDDGDRVYLPIMHEGVERWKPHAKCAADEIESYLINTDRPTLANHVNANRRREIELVILRNEERLAGETLTVADVAPFVDQATHWLAQTP